MACTKAYYLKNREAILIKRKKYYQDNREYTLSRQKEYNLKNREKINKKAKLYAVQYRKDNKEVILIKQRYYYSTERGFIRKLWSSIRRSSRKHKRINEFKNFNQFYDHWLEQKSKYGMKCPATGIEMTNTIGTNKPGEHKRIMTNISTDRILSTEGYSPKNLIFTTWLYNRSKCDITPEMAKAFLRIVGERYGV
tara:strand:- start:132 stop:716 length:585 start_codon:yes stop_codon:yes gene_type:complete